MPPTKDQPNALNQIGELRNIGRRHYGDALATDAAAVAIHIENAVGTTLSEENRRDLFVDVMDMMTRQMRRVALDAFDTASHEATAIQQQRGTKGLL